MSDVRALAERLRELAASATQGEWWPGPHYRTDVQSSDGIVAEARPFMSPRGATNAAYIAAANPEAVIAIIEWGLAADTRATELEKENSILCRRLAMRDEEVDNCDEWLKDARARATEAERERDAAEQAVADLMTQIEHLDTEARAGRGP